MIALMNYVVPILFISGVFLMFRLKKSWPGIVCGVLILIYTVAQPTYLPKGTVAAPVIQELEYVEKPIVDRSRKVMSDEQRDALRNEKLKQINESIESKISKGE